MMFSVFIEPHERYEAIEAWKDRLTDAQLHEIDDAPDTALVRLYALGSGLIQVQIIEEG